MYTPTLAETSVRKFNVCASSIEIQAAMVNYSGEADGNLWSAQDANDGHEFGIMIENTTIH